MVRQQNPKAMLSATSYTHVFLYLAITLEIIAMAAAVHRKRKAKHVHEEIQKILR